LEADEKMYAMGAGCSPDEQAKVDYCGKMGLVCGHAYSLIAAKNIPSDDGSNVQLVCLRNPWGHHEWTGRWSDGSDLWTDAAKQICNYTDADDGIFWMDF